MVVVPRHRPIVVREVATVNRFNTLVTIDAGRRARTTCDQAAQHVAPGSS